MVCVTCKRYLSLAFLTSFWFRCVCSNRMVTNCCLAFDPCFVFSSWLFSFSCLAICVVRSQGSIGPCVRCRSVLRPLRFLQRRGGLVRLRCFHTTNVSFLFLAASFLKRLLYPDGLLVPFKATHDALLFLFFSFFLSFWWRHFRSIYCTSMVC